MTMGVEKWDTLCSPFPVSDPADGSDNQRKNEPHRVIEPGNTEHVMGKGYRAKLA